MKARDLVKEHEDFLICSDTTQEILNGNYEIAEDFIECLNSLLDLPEIPVSLKREIPDEYYGYWEYKKIVIYTLKFNGQFVEPKFFLRQLIHEWKHHYEFYYLRIDRKRHSKAFYKNVKEIVNLFVK